MWLQQVFPTPTTKKAEESPPGVNQRVPNLPVIASSQPGQAAVVKTNPDNTSKSPLKTQCSTSYMIYNSKMKNQTTKGIRKSVFLLLGILMVVVLFPLGGQALCLPPSLVHACLSLSSSSHTCLYWVTIKIFHTQTPFQDPMGLGLVPLNSLIHDAGSWPGIILNQDKAHPRLPLILLHTHLTILPHTPHIARAMCLPNKLLGTARLKI